MRTSVSVKMIILAKMTFNGHFGPQELYFRTIYVTFGF